MVEPTPIQLEPHGPYIAPICQEFLDLRPCAGQSQAHTHLLRILLERGTQLHLPMKDTVWQRLYRALKELIEPHQSGQFVRIHDVSEIPKFHWDKDGKKASVQFPYRDGNLTALSIPAPLLEKLRDEIGDAIARRPQQS